MRALTAAEVLGAWERLHPLRGIAGRIALLEILGLEPDASIGAEDAALLTAYARNFSSTVDAVARCPRCATEVELTVPLAELTAGMPSPVPAEPLVHGAYTVDWRVPRGADLAAAAACGDAETGAVALLSRCVRQARRDGQPIPAPALPASVRAQLAERVAAADPYAEISFRLVCPQCDAHWESPLDPAEFVLAQLRSRAWRLVSEVDALARAYGWAEADILALSQARRDMYLELAYE